MRKSNKKGSVQDIALIFGIILFFAVAMLISFKVSSEYNNFIQGDSNFDAQGKQASEKITGYFPGVVDNTFLFFAIGLSLVTLGLAVAVRFHPIFIIFFLLGLIFLIFLSALGSNIYSQMASHAILEDEANQLIFSRTIMQRLPLIIGIVGFLLMIIMYRQWRIDQ